jgi:proteasome accessory factor B
MFIRHSASAETAVARGDIEQHPVAGLRYGHQGGVSQCANLVRLTPIPAGHLELDGARPYGAGRRHDTIGPDDHAVTLAGLVACVIGHADPEGTEKVVARMATRKTERILNLTICLLVSGRYLPKSKIREAVEGYHNLSDAAFERTFERDKDELRSLGVPIEVGSFDPLFDDELGYRILPSEFELPPIDLDPEEASVVGVAARVWQHAGMAESTRSAVAKLRAAGVEPDTSQLGALEPSVQATEPAFEPLWNAVLHRTRVSFGYRDGARRTLEPWGLTSSKGRWYVIGRDVDRDATRMFKLARISDRPKRVSRAGAYQVPESLDLRSLARSLNPREPTASATLAIRAGKAPALRRQGEAGTWSRSLPGGFEVYEVGYSDLGSFAEEITRHAADVLVLEPADLRTEVIRNLSAVVAASAA